MNVWSYNESMREALTEIDSKVKADLGGKQIYYSMTTAADFGGAKDKLRVYLLTDGHVPTKETDDIIKQARKMGHDTEKDTRVHCFGIGEYFS